MRKEAKAKSSAEPSPNTSKTTKPNIATLLLMVNNDGE